MPAAAYSATPVGAIGPLTFTRIAPAYILSLVTPNSDYPMVWPSRDPSDLIPVGIDCTNFLTNNKLTLTGMAVVADPSLTVISHGLISSNGVSTGVWARIVGGISGGSPMVGITLQFSDMTNGPVDQILVLVEQPVFTRFPGNLVIGYTSPVLLAPGAAWYNVFRQSFCVAPNWATLPTVAPTNPDAFYLIGNEVAISAASTFLPATVSSLNIGDLYNNGGVVSAFGNPGLPVYTLGMPTGILYYNGGPLGVS